MVSFVLWAERADYCSLFFCMHAPVMLPCEVKVGVGK